MKITKQYLKRLIKEELEKILHEGPFDDLEKEMGDYGKEPPAPKPKPSPVPAEEPPAPDAPAEKPAQPVKDKPTAIMFLKAYIAIGGFAGKSKNRKQQNQKTALIDKYGVLRKSKGKMKDGTVAYKVNGILVREGEL